MISHWCSPGGLLTPITVLRVVVDVIVLPNELQLHGISLFQLGYLQLQSAQI